VVAGSSPGGESWPWKANRNTQGGLLRSAGWTSSWGFGVHAQSELHFPLPPQAKAFRSRIGLDRLAGKGGCVRARVFMDSTEGAPLYESPFIVGSDKLLDTGSVPLAASKGRPHHLILQVDPAHQGRPDGADPLDIRDIFDWLSPQLELDPVKVREQTARRAEQAGLYGKARIWKK